MWQLPEGESETAPLFRRGMWHGYRDRKPESEDSVYIAGWCQGYHRKTGLGLCHSEEVFISSLYAGGLEG
jgi:hypothetical protein